MKKHFMFVAAVMFGFLFAFSSCKGNKSNHHDDDEDEDDEELVENDNKDKDDDDDSGSHSKASVKLADVLKDNDLQKLDDVDLADLDMSGVSLSDIEKMQFDGISPQAANVLLQLAAKQVNSMVPMNLGEGMKLTGFDVNSDDVTMTMVIDEAMLQGATIEQLGVLMNDKSMKAQLMNQMVSGMDSDGLFAMKMIVATNKDFVLKFIGKNGGASANCRLTTSDLSSLVK